MRMKFVDEIANFLCVMCDLITFVRASAKRLHIFKEIQIQFFQDDDEEQKEAVSLKPFCLTRWTVRVKSLRSADENYEKILKFCEVVELEKTDSVTKARGFLEYLQQFEPYILLQITISTLEKLEAPNETIQAKTINFRGGIEMLRAPKNKP